MKKISIIIFLIISLGCSRKDYDGYVAVASDEVIEIADSLLLESDTLLSNDKYDLAQIVLDSTLKLAISAQDTALLSGAYNNLGFLNEKRGNIVESIQLYEKALNLDRLLNDSLKMAQRLKNLGISYRKGGNNQRALRLFQESLDVADLLGLEEEKASVSNSIGNIYNYLKEYEKSVEYLTAAQEWWSSKGDSLKTAYALSNLGNSYLGLGKPQEAIDNYKKAIVLKESLNKMGSLAITLNNLGEAYITTKEYRKSRDCLNQSMEIRKRLKQTTGIGYVANNLGALEIAEGNYVLAQNWLNKAEKIATEVGVRDMRLNNLRLQKRLYAATGEYRRAFEIDAAYDEMKDKDFNEQVVKVKDLEYEYDIEQETKKNIAFQNQLELAAIRSEGQEFRSKVQAYIIAAAALTLLIVSYFAYRLRKKNQHIENLIRELHHRVKNHLGMISGMFGAQTGLSDLDAAVLDEAKTRLEAVNGIHRRLYRQDEYEFVNMQEYLEELVDNNALVFGLFHKLDKQIDIKAEVMEIDKAISVGLIANEVLTNAFKYGLQQTEKPILKIVLEKVVEGYRMVISNNASSDKSEGKGFGAELISRLAQNLKGNTEIDQANGFQFELTFP